MNNTLVSKCESRAESKFWSNADLLGGYKVEALEQAFFTVANPGDWRAEINAVVGADKLAITVQAIEFYTATETRVLPRNGGFQVYSIGYRAGPAGC